MTEKLKPNWSRELKAVNSKVLLREVTFMVEDLMESLNLDWTSEVRRAELVVGIESNLQDLCILENKIQQFKVMCDMRNNRIANMERGLFYLTVQYKQTNCLNTTQIIYTIRTGRA